MFFKLFNVTDDGKLQICTFKIKYILLLFLIIYLIWK